MKIGNLIFEKGIFLAPMAGITDVGFRKICSDCGAELCYTEMVSAKGLFYGSEKTEELLAFDPCHKYKAVQIFGSDPKIMGIVCKKLCQSFDIIDINMGCPAPKIWKNGDGCAIMSNLTLAEEIIIECVKNSTVPITVKFRSGIDDNNINAIDFAQMCERAGASAITIHGRTRQQFYSGQVNYEIIKQVVDAVSIPVIGNGDITDLTSYNKMLETGCQGVMIGRGALGNPFIFCELTGQKTPYSKEEAVHKHVDILKKYFEESYINKYFRKHFLWYLHGVRDATEYKNKITSCTSINEALTIFHDAIKRSN